MMSLLSNIRDQMEIITVDGACLGRVASLSEPDQIRVSGHGKAVPVRWIAWVDGSVYLTKTRQQVVAIWKREIRTARAPSDLRDEGSRQSVINAESAAPVPQRQGSHRDADHPTPFAHQSEAKRAGLA
jgi:hypothetical protein